MNLCESEFSNMVNTKTKYRYKLDISNSLRLKATRVEVYVKTVMAKQETISSFPL